ncbi:LPS export ABC transporter protein LptC [Fibrobacter sp. UWT3]|uniref:LPS export ABC transporter periplasmic protein LptC n=1 Tax=Fibrobacter sp. UWT3 TaxID=1896225 RepID=UPI000BD42763|nr:LPS export ABC transporter periplasmic protein LptC [Fibrobacter sp. UWT3]SOE76160.1 LPS export ABC transporter protein LptC [Fibrobacter sp. UWT3]
MARFLQYILRALKSALYRGSRCMPGPRYAVVPVALCVALFMGCEEIEEEKPWIHVDRPQMLFTDTTLLDCYDKDVLSWKLKTAYLERWSDKEVVFMRPVLVDIYDSVGERVAFLRADSGRMDMHFTYVYAYGHVYALTPKGASVRADSLLWNKRDNMVRTDSYVRVVSEDGDVLQGKGFESDARMDNWRILSNVTGIFQDAAKRMKEEDKKQAEELEKKPDSTAAPAVAHPPPVAKTAPAKTAPAKTAPPQPAKVAPASAPPVRTAPNAAPPADSAHSGKKGRFKSIARRGVSERITEDAAAMPAPQEEPAADPNGGTRPRAKRRE